MKKVHLTVKGKKHTWYFQVLADPKYIPEWKADGLDVSPIRCESPALITKLGLQQVWFNLFWRNNVSSKR